jgi:hypothetical protein
MPLTLLAFGPARLHSAFGGEKGRDQVDARLSNPITMKKLTCALVLGVFGSCCSLAWAMLTLMFDVRNAGRVLPYFTNVCITLRPGLLGLPALAIAYYLWLWFHREEKTSRWMGFVVATMAALILFVLPAISTSYLLMIDQVRMATGAH